LCAPGEKPEFSLFSWFSMLFFTTMAASIMVWGFVEPTFYYSNPPYGIEAFSSAAYEWSLLQTFFHWGPNAYSCYIPFAVGIAYTLHVRKDPHLRVSAACKNIIGEKRANGTFGKVLDIFVMFGILGGMSTSFGMAVPVVLEGVAHITGLEPSPMLMGVLLVLWTLVFGVSVYRGLEKGIKVLSNFNAIVAAIFIAIVLVLGPTLFIFKMFVNTSGMYFQNVFRMSTFMDPIDNTGFVEGWTVFYWAWYLGFATAVGVFVARISRGRTIRQVVIGCTAAISLSAWIIQAIFGSYVINLEMTGVLAVSEIIKEFGTNRAVLEIIKTLPFGNFIVFMHTLLLFTFVATSLDSTSFTLATMSTAKLKGDEEPLTRIKLLWAVMLLTITGTLAAIGGLGAIQVSAIVSSLPLVGVCLLLLVALVKMLKEDLPMENQNLIVIDYAKKMEEKKTNRV
jgi:BCCT family betaine/carnitine transporter